MSFVLPARPGWGELLGTALGQGAQNLAQGYGQGQALKQQYMAQLRLEAAKQKAETDIYSKFADDLLKDNPDDKRIQMMAKIYKLDLPLDQKQTLLKGLVGADPWSLSREFYLNRKDIADSYDREIKGYESLLKSNAFTDPNQEKALQDKIQAKMKEREERLALYDAQFKSQLGFSAPSIAAPEGMAPPPAQKAVAPTETRQAPMVNEPKAAEEPTPETSETISYGPEKEGEMADVVMPKMFNIRNTPIKMKVRKRVKFNPNNPQHIARRDEILKKSGKDRAKAKQVMLKEFEI